jgi:hypothetical protein
LSSVGPSEAAGGTELDELMRRTRLRAADLPRRPAQGRPEAPEAPGLRDLPPASAGSSLPQQIFLQAMREEIEHFLAQSDLGAELDEERRLFEQLKLLGERLNENYIADERPADRAGPPLARLKNLLRRLLAPVFRLVLGPRLRRQTQFNATLVQFQNSMAQLQVQVVSVQRLYKAHLSNVSKNLLSMIELLHQSDLRLNDKLDLLVTDLDRQLVALRQSLPAQAHEPRSG